MGAKIIRGMQISREAYKHKLRIFYAQSSIFFQNPACKKSLRSEPSVFGTPLKIFRF